MVTWIHRRPKWPFLPSSSVYIMKIQLIKEQDAQRDTTKEGALGCQQGACCYSKPPHTGFLKIWWLWSVSHSHTHCYGRRHTLNGITRLVVYSYCHGWHAIAQTPRTRWRWCKVSSKTTITCKWLLTNYILRLAVATSLHSCFVQPLFWEAALYQGYKVPGGLRGFCLGNINKSQRLAGLYLLTQN